MASAQHHYRQSLLALEEITRDDGSICFGDGGEAYAMASLIHAVLTVAAVQAEATLGRVVVLDLDGPSLRPHGAPS